MSFNELIMLIECRFTANRNQLAQGFIQVINNRILIFQWSLEKLVKKTKGR